MNASSQKSTDLGLLALRIGMGIMFVFHGYPKLAGGPELWEKIGGAMGSFGIHFAPAFWGLMAALAETAGGAFLAAGLAFRPACGFLAFTMLTAATRHFSAGDGLKGAAHAVECGIVFVGLFIAGPGNLRLKLKK